jgi:hypothetical protein
VIFDVFYEFDAEQNTTANHVNALVSRRRNHPEERKGRRYARNNQKAV